ncbi:DNA-directed RNA polymerase subunit L [Candidatus Woesearchaeota archaeon]|jgi:DNA-directed RNA polymerase subunit L|nr:DNA-directed RNA polymerase subunit L [Candidatus Woesearchaeota archaeon]
MEFNIIEESKKRIVFELTGETHSFCNALKNELLKVKGVEIATYKIDHPLVGIPTFVLETSGIEPRDALKKGIEGLKKLAKEFQKEVKKL